MDCGKRIDKMKCDRITKIEIDAIGKLYIKPEIENFNLIYRTASEVHWDINKKALYSPIPRDWSYLEWYKHIVKIIKTECFVELKIDDKTIWKNITEDLKEEITKA